MEELIGKGISRRRLLQALGVAAITAPMGGFGQGRCFGDKKGPRNATPHRSSRRSSPPAGRLWRSIIFRLRSKISRKRPPSTTR